MDEIKEVILQYVSGRQISLNKLEAMAALTREEWMEGKPNLVLLIDSPEDGLKIYRNGEGMIFKHSQGVTEFANQEELSKDKYWDTIYETFGQV